MPRSPDVPALVDGIRAGSRPLLARAITLIESTRADHRAQARELLAKLAPLTPETHRIGISGVPGVGKSTLIDALGSRLTAAGRKVAVLAVDPSSSRSGGSILGDKTRMTRLAVDPNAFVRPSPTAGTLGGVATATRESIVLVEAAGYDVVLVETVGVGQSEIAVANMVDTFLFLTLARTGDQLQGIKRGILELADLVAVNKADGPHETEARSAARELAGALRMLRPAADGWRPKVVTCSGQTEQGLSELWDLLATHRQKMADSGRLAENRRRQAVEWTWSIVRATLTDRLREHPGVQKLTPALEQQVRDGTLTPAVAAEHLLAAFDTPTRNGESPAM